MSRSVDRQLDQAAERCRARGQSLTALRRRVLAIMLEAERPLGAYDVLDILASERGRTAPPTVYRSLDFLVEQGLVHKVLSINGFIACRAAARPHAAELFICRACGITTEIAQKPADRRLEAAASEIDFLIETVVLEVRGLCQRCRAGEAS